MSEHDDRLVRRVAEAAAGRDPDGPCPDAEALGLYAERGLASDEYGHVEAHLAGCARCQATVAAFVSSAPEAADVAGAAGQGVDGVQRWWAGWRWLVPVTATAAVLMLAVWVGRGPSEQAAESARGSRPIRRSPNGPSCRPTRSRRRQRRVGSTSGRPPTRPGSCGRNCRSGRSDARRPRGACGRSAGRREAIARRAAAPPPAAPSALAAGEARFERAQPERQREVEARRDAATDQCRAREPPAPALRPPPPRASGRTARRPRRRSPSIQPPRPLAVGEVCERLAGNDAAARRRWPRPRRRLRTRRRRSAWWS